MWSSDFLMNLTASLKLSSFTLAVKPVNSLTVRKLSRKSCTENKTKQRRFKSKVLLPEFRFQSFREWSCFYSPNIINIINVRTKEISQAAAELSTFICLVNVVFHHLSKYFSSVCSIFLWRLFSRLRSKYRSDLELKPAVLFSLNDGFHVFLCLFDSVSC